MVNEPTEFETRYVRLNRSCGHSPHRTRDHLLVHNEHPKQEVDGKSTTLPYNRITNELNTQSSYIHGRHAIKLDWNGRTSVKNKPAIGRTQVLRSTSMAMDKGWRTHP